MIILPNLIVTELCFAIDQRFARQLVDLAQNRSLLLFGAMGGGKDPRKGADLLPASLSKLCSEARI